MPKITAIVRQKKNYERVNIFLEDEYAFSLDQFSVIKNSLKVGTNLSAEQINDLTKSNFLNSLTDKALNFLTYRQRSEKEVRQYLAKKISSAESLAYKSSAQSPLIKIVINKLKKYKYLDDNEFAKWWIKSRTTTKPKGQRLIQLELRSKGVQEEVIQKALKKIPNEISLAKKAIAKKVTNWGKLPPEKFKKKVFNYLIARGFDYDTVKNVFAFFEKKL